MSQWTNVRIIYDVISTDLTSISKWYKKAESHFDELAKVGGESIYNIGSEEPLKVYFYPEYGMSTFVNGKTERIDDRGTLVMFGNIRDCSPEEFNKALKDFKFILELCRIKIMSELVKVE